MICNKCKKEFDPLLDLITFGATLAMYVDGELKQICFYCAHENAINTNQSSQEGSDTSNVPD